MRCRGWQQEAALRMLENNLHPDVAEKPEDLVVYGGIGKAARNQACLRAIKRELQGLGGHETLLVQSGKPVAVFETHPDAPRVLIANSNLVPRWANWEHVPQARRRRADDVRPDDRRVLDLHRDPGDPPGHLRDVRGDRAQALRRLAGRPARRHRRARRHGRRAAAGDHHERRRALCVEVDLQRIERRIETGYLDERAADRSTTRCARLDAARGRAPRAVHRPARQRRRGAAGARAARRGGRRRDRPDERARPAQRLRPRRADGRAGRRAARSRPRRLPAPRRRERARARGRDPRPAGGRRRGVRLRQRAARPRRGARRRRRVRLPRLRPRLHPPAVLRGQGPVPLGRAVRRPGRHRARPTTRSSSCSATRSTSARWIELAARARAVPGAAGADLLAGLRRAPPRRAALQRDGGVGRAARRRS